jgi:hypothetical protein
MRTIWKFPLQHTDTQNVAMPWDAQILTVGVVNEQICLWAMVEDHGSSETRVIRIIGTGHPIDGAELLRYIGTVQLMGGKLIFHVFELK